MLLDYRLPDGDGASLLAELCVGDAQVTRLLISAYPADLPDVARRIADGSVQFMEKPLDIPQVIALANRVEATHP